MITFDEAIQIITRLEDAIRYARIFADIVRRREPLDAEKAALVEKLGALLECRLNLLRQPCNTFSAMASFHGVDSCRGGL